MESNRDLLSDPENVKLDYQRRNVHITNNLPVVSPIPLCFGGSWATDECSWLSAISEVWGFNVSVIDSSVEESRSQDMDCGAGVGRCVFGGQQHRYCCRSVRFLRRICVVMSISLPRSDRGPLAPALIRAEAVQTTETMGWKQTVTRG